MFDIKRKHVSIRMEDALLNKIRERGNPSKAIRFLIINAIRFEKLLAQARELATRYKITRLIVTVKGKNDETKPA